MTTCHSVVSTTLKVQTSPTLSLFSSQKLLQPSPSVRGIRSRCRSSAPVSAGVHLLLYPRRRPNVIDTDRPLTVIPVLAFPTGKRCFFLLTSRFYSCCENNDSQRN